MARNWFAIAILAAMTVPPGALAQQKNELGAIIGRTYISDQGVQGLPSFDTNLHSGRGMTLEVNYGRLLRPGNLFDLTVEVPFAFNPDEDVHYSVNAVPKDYKSFFITPSIRANLFPDHGLSPWVSLGGGYGRFNTNSELEFGGANPSHGGTSTGVLQVGGGLDVHLFRWGTIRGQVRDFYSGVPSLNVDTGKSRQHNYFVGGGLIFRF